ncbi:hypothetical protein DACRYDRAFT_110680 [Dacryopinax primogenitus]|uniref:Uncharacterized protein n=1 Tax=Dacryopinax primogenitus (strain DJM 731) TaxID=1858805 RepID=M5FYY1_DACPD|nr:uncharacterized protein DACRYDRAFT_110680 [Dacryopinax primogenitus]EJT98786.1 hypothetical protein DACRYDRAFT_110680 [Dacryopinax primogenitus]
MPSQTSKQKDTDWSFTFGGGDSDGEDDEPLPPPQPRHSFPKLKGKAKATDAPSASSAPKQSNPWDAARQAALLKRKEAEGRAQANSESGEPLPKQPRIEPKKKKELGPIERGLKLQWERAEAEKKVEHETQKDVVPSPAPVRSLKETKSTHIPGSSEQSAIYPSPAPSAAGRHSEIPSMQMSGSPQHGASPHPPGPASAWGYPYPPIPGPRDGIFPYPAQGSSSSPAPPALLYPGYYPGYMHAPPVPPNSPWQHTPPAPATHLLPPFRSSPHAPIASGSSGHSSPFTPPIAPYMRPSPDAYRPALQSPLSLESPRSPYTSPGLAGRRGSSVNTVRNILKDALHSASSRDTVESHHGMVDPEAAYRASLKQDQVPGDPHALLSSFAYTPQPSSSSTPPPERNLRSAQTFPQFSNPVVSGQRSSPVSPARHPRKGKSRFATRHEDRPRSSALSTSYSSPSDGSSRLIPSSHPSMGNSDETWSTFEEKAKRPAKAVSSGAFLMPDVFHSGPKVKVVKEVGDKTIRIGYRPSGRKRKLAEEEVTPPDEAKGPAWKVHLLTPNAAPLATKIVASLPKGLTVSSDVNERLSSPTWPTQRSHMTPQSRYDTNEAARTDVRTADDPSSETLYDPHGSISNRHSKSADAEDPPHRSGSTAHISMDDITRTYPSTRQAIAQREAEYEKLVDTLGLDSAGLVWQDDEPDGGRRFKTVGKGLPRE